MTDNDSTKVIRDIQRIALNEHKPQKPGLNRNARKKLKKEKARAAEKTAEAEKRAPATL